jgi:hypothetical protein
MEKYFCENVGSINSDIPIRLVDTNTILQKKCNKFHTRETHLFCIILRIIISILILNGYFGKYGVILLCIFVILGFLSKCLMSNKTWKNYCRIIILYSSVLLINLTSLEKQDKNTISFVIILTDAIMGQQSRHTATLLN